MSNQTIRGTHPLTTPLQVTDPLSILTCSNTTDPTPTHRVSSGGTNCKATQTAWLRHDSLPVWRFAQRAGQPRRKRRKPRPSLRAVGGLVPARYRFLPRSIRAKIAVIRAKCVSKSPWRRWELWKGKHVKSVGLSETRGISNGLKYSARTFVSATGKQKNARVRPQQCPISNSAGISWT